MIKTKRQIQLICVCNQCANEWVPKVKIPKQCPKCKRVDWNR